MPRNRSGPHLSGVVNIRKDGCGFLAFLRLEKFMGKKSKVIVGRVFGRLTVLEALNPSSGGFSKFLCLCLCGAHKEVLGKSLLSGNTVSCGCFRLEQLKQRNLTHGMTGTPEHRVWKAVRGRCNNPNSDEFSNYGGRGIKVDDSWRDYAVFFKDMGFKLPGQSIERLDVNGPYEKANCIWADAHTQSRNKRNNIRILYAGESLILNDVAELLGLNRQLIRYRISKDWPEEDWFKPAGHKRNKPAKEIK